MTCVCAPLRCWAFGHCWHFTCAQPFYAAMEYTDRCCRCGKYKSKIVMED